VVDADLDSQVPWLATAYVDGPSLAGAVTSNGPLPPASVLDLATGTEVARIPQDNAPPNMAFSPDGAQLITREGNTVTLWAT
jgi:hypothetical protein